MRQESGREGEAGHAASDRARSWRALQDALPGGGIPGGAITAAPVICRRREGETRARQPTGETGRRRSAGWESTKPTQSTSRIHSDTCTIPCAASYPQLAVG